MKTLLSILQMIFWLNPFHAALAQDVALLVRDRSAFEDGSWNRIRREVVSHLGDLWQYDLIAVESEIYDSAAIAIRKRRKDGEEPSSKDFELVYIARGDASVLRKKIDEKLYEKILSLAVDVLSNAKEDVEFDVPFDEKTGEALQVYYGGLYLYCPRFTKGTDGTLYRKFLTGYIGKAKKGTKTWELSKMISEASGSLAIKSAMESNRRNREYFKKLREKRSNNKKPSNPGRP